MPPDFHIHSAVRTDGTSRLEADNPCIFVVAGPNGAGKSTTAPVLLRERLQVKSYVNADTIAAGLSAFEPEAAAFQAGRIMLSRLDELRRQRSRFAFETTLATRGYARWLKQCRAEGFQVCLLFLSLTTPELALQRVADRVRAGGHDVKEAVIRRRYQSGIRNFFHLYRPLCERWFVLDNSAKRPRLLAHGGIHRPTVIKDPGFNQLEAIYGDR